MNSILYLTPTDHKCTELDEDKELVCTLTTDLIATYNIIDHEILTGLSGDSINFLRSFFCEWRTFVQLQDFNSSAKTMNPFPVLQGSKMTILF